ncbi:group 1 glycosyl transferase [Sphaerospermopsis kisseleviana NIES-73]|nr:group 1 glycosyl transferase [Sphaerospermopsis kisseleviana NIES-73]
MGRCHDMDTILETAKLLRDEPIQFVCISIGAKRQSFMEEVNDLGLTKFSVSVLLRKKSVTLLSDSLQSVFGKC